MFAALNANDTGYRLLLLGHILFMIVGFGSSFVWPFIGVEMKKRPGPAGLALSEFAMKTSKLVTTYAIYLGGAFGLALAIAGDRMGELWINISLPLFIVMVLFAGFVHVPNLDKLDAVAHQLTGPPNPQQAAELAGRGKAAARNGGILHLAFLVVLILMIWQPT
ncbi:MAG: hypothetical protein JF603_06915 [Acidobacteria bacterium]|nr:hypothetical protein [Acidobacteriota bacterium]